MTVSGALHRAASRSCCLILLLAVLGAAANLATAARAAAASAHSAMAAADVPAETPPTPVVAVPLSKPAGDRVDEDPAGAERRTTRKTKAVASPVLPVVARWSVFARPPAAASPRLPDSGFRPTGITRLAWGMRGPPAGSAADPFPRLAVRR